MSRPGRRLCFQEQRAILDAFLQLLGDQDSRLRGFLNTICPAGEPQGKPSFVETFRVKVGTFLCVRFATQSRHQRWGVAKGIGVRKPHGTLHGIKGFHRAMPWLLRLDHTTTYDDIMEFIPVHTIEKTGTCRVEMTLILPEAADLAVPSVIEEHHVVSLAPIREQLLQDDSNKAKQKVVKETLVDLKAANIKIRAANKVPAEKAEKEGDQHRELSKKETTQAKKQAKAASKADIGQQKEAPCVVKALTPADMKQQAEAAGETARQTYLCENSLMDVLVIKAGASRGASCPQPLTHDCVCV